MNASDEVNRWLNYRANTRERTDKTDKSVYEEKLDLEPVSSVSYVSSDLPYSRFNKGQVKARVIGKDKTALSYEAEVCWHCRGSFVCNCATCGHGLPWEWKAGQCGCCRGTGYLCWGDTVQ